jgi:hypothetical protein
VQDRPTGPRFGWNPRPGSNRSEKRNYASAGLQPSFVTFVTKGNNARLRVESQCAITARTANYLFFASCKSENTFAPEDLFHADNYDFCGSTRSIFRTKSTHHAGWKEQGLWADRFENVHQHLVRVEGRELATPAEMVRASLDNVPLVGRVEIAAPDQAASAVLEFPIKTMNANDIETIYQVDTGPLAFPDFSAPSGRSSGCRPTWQCPGLRRFHRATTPGGGRGPGTHYSNCSACPPARRSWP